MFLTELKIIRGIDFPQVLETSTVLCLIAELQSSLGTANSREEALPLSQDPMYRRCSTEQPATAETVGG